MDKRAWVHQLKKQVDVKGEDKASWYVSWYDPEGVLRTKSCGPGKIGKSAAKTVADTIHSELVTGTYQSKKKKTWADFRSEYESKIVSRFEGKSKQAIMDTLKVFERVAKPKTVQAITTELVDDFATKRLAEKGIRKRTLSPATVNKDLRYVRSMMRIAHEWGLVVKVPKFRFLKTAKKMPTFVPPEHFTAIYKACDAASLPNDVPNVSAGDWWRALIVLAYMTGWRVGQIVSLKWSDIDLDKGTALTRAEVAGNKGNRDERIPLHPIAVTHLRRLAGSFDERVFPWSKQYRKLWPIFEEIQRNATLADGTPLPECGKNGWYGFHDFRRAFATLNAQQMDLFELQGLMQHKSLDTTRQYVNMASQLNETVKNLFVPSIPETSSEVG